VSTIRKVAQAAGVSIATVSRVINHRASVTEEVRTKVLEAVNRCGYVPAVSRRNTALLALVYAGPASPGSSFDAALVEGMRLAMDSVDYDLVMLNPARDRAADETYTQYFLRKGVRGVILRSTAGFRAVCEEIAAEDFPAVVVGDRFPNSRLSFVYADSYGASKRAIGHLLALGHRRIAFAANESDDADHADRYRGYGDAMREAGATLHADLVFRIPARRPDGVQLLRNLMSAPTPPTAVYITDPAVAVGLVNEAHRMQVAIPRELSVIGFDDRDTRNYVHPKMTAVCQDATHLGRVAMLHLAALVEAGRHDVASPPPASTWLELNATTAPPPQGTVRVLHDGTRLDVPQALPPRRKSARR
jgi:DNA-binding LacI/PurR family transcriptional regulator